MARSALRVVQIGAIAAVLVALPYTVFDLDRFLIPKELVLHLTAVIAGLFAFGAIRRLEMTRVDLLLTAYIVFGALSALFATNRWLGLRGVAVSASGVLIFWIARALNEADLQRPLLAGIAVAVVIAAGTALFQAYGLRIDFFAMSRVPGGTLGNRNFVAHVAAFGLPVCMLMAMSSSIALPGVALVTAALVLTRSRAAWLACAVMFLVFLFGLIVAREWRSLRRLLLIVVAGAIGAGAALALPNALHWRSDNPYLETAQSVANYEGGSGRGRLVQYGRSLLMSARHPLFGVGPGNWPVVYPSHVPRSDPSLNPSEPGMTYNPWPSSDWIAFISERGLIAAVLLALALIGIAIRFPAPPETGQPGSAVLHWTLIAVLAAVVVEGMFDAVLLLAVPTLLVWAALGALAPRQPVTRPFRTLVLSGVLLVSLAGAAYSAAVVFSMNVMVQGGTRRALEQASAIDPGNYRLHMRLAQGGRDRCAHATAAHDLFPTSAEAARLSRGCR
jgi:O-antigen ligase/polysaccharide polymerase Wzy-like membrane protein